MARNAAVSEVRAWAKSNGFDIGDRGRLPTEVWDAWAAAEKPAGRPANRAVRAEPTPAPPAVDPVELQDARERIARLEAQLADVTSRLAAVEQQPQPQPRRLFARNK